MIDRFSTSKVTADGDENSFEVWGPNWKAFGRFLVASGCWVHAGMDGRAVAFDVVAAETIWRLSGMHVSPITFGKVQVIAFAALDEMNLIHKEEMERIEQTRPKPPAHTPYAPPPGSRTRRAP